MKRSVKSWNFKQLYASIKAKSIQAEPKQNWRKVLESDNAFRQLQAMIMLDYKEKLITCYYTKSNEDLNNVLAKFDGLKQIQNCLEDYKLKYRIGAVGDEVLQLEDD